VTAPYIGRLAPSPTGYLHLGHARTFWIAAERARRANGTLLLRNDDLDTARCRSEYVRAGEEDLRWLGLEWQPPVVTQSERKARYRKVLERLHDAGLIFACARSRRDVLEAAGAPHEGAAEDEPVYPIEFRPPPSSPLPPLGEKVATNWRFRVPEGRELSFLDQKIGRQTAVVGRDLGDFIVWRKDDTPSYQLATVVDDHDMGITEVVRGADLVRSTFRQLMLFEALGWKAPEFYHAPLMTDEAGHRLAKRHDALALRSLRERGVKPDEILAQFRNDFGSV